MKVIRVETLKHLGDYLKENGAKREIIGIVCKTMFIKDLK